MKQVKVKSASNIESKKKKPRLFADDYVDLMTKQVLLIHPEYNPKDVKAVIRKKCKETFKNPKVQVDDEEVRLMNIVDLLRRKKFILSGSGSLFKQHKDGMSVEWYLVDDLGNERSKYKKIKFVNIEKANEGDAKSKAKYQLGENYQLAFKLMGNSYFGVNLEKNSFFYNPWIGPAITQTGQYVIVTSISTFERFVSGNFYFRQLNDIGVYVNTILDEDYDISIFLDEDFLNDEDTLYELTYTWLYEKCTKNLTKREQMLGSYLMNVLSSLTSEQLAKVYFKNNIQEFLTYASDVGEVFQNIILENEDFLDTNNPPEYYQESLDYVWYALDSCVAYYHNDFFQMDNAKYKPRKTILTVDTDSNFIYLHPLIQFAHTHLGLELTDIHRMTASMSYAYFMTKIISNMFAVICKKSFNIEDETKHRFISMKNELTSKLLYMVTYIANSFNCLGNLIYSSCR